MKKNFLLLFLVFSGCFLSVPEKKNDETLIIPPQKECDSLSKIEKKVEGKSMEPLIKNGSSVLLLENYYTLCFQKPKKGDIIAYHYLGNNHLLIKKIVATDLDTVEVKSGTLWVNDKNFINSEGESYSFTNGEQKMLELYTKNKKLPKDSYFILGDNTHVSDDSRKFGAVSLQDIAGKFEIIKN